MGNERMVEIVRQYGPERIIVDSACDWGVSDPLGVPKTATLMRAARHRRRASPPGHYDNALAAYGQSGQMQGGGLARARRRSTSAPCTRATRSCAAAASPRVEEPKVKRPMDELLIE